MGVDLLDIKCRIHRRLGVELDMQSLFQRSDGTWIRTPVDCTAGDVLQAVVRTANSQSIQLPEDAWSVVQGVIAECLSFDAVDVKPESLLIQDLGAE